MTVDRISELAARSETVLAALHRLSEAAGDHRLYANQAVFHQLYTDVDETFAELEAIARDGQRALDVPCQHPDHSRAGAAS